MVTTGIPVTVVPVTDNVTFEAPVELNVIFPLGVVAEAVILTVIVVVETVPDVGVNVREVAQVEPPFEESSIPLGAATVIAP